MDDTGCMRIAIEKSARGDWPYRAAIVKEGMILVKEPAMIGSGPLS